MNSMTNVNELFDNLFDNSEDYEILANVAIKILENP